MNDKEPILSLNRPLGILQPEEENGYLIPLSDWSFLKSKVDKIEEPTVLYNTISSVLLGASGSALLACIGFLATKNINIAIHIISWAIFTLCLISGFICLHFDNITRKQYNTKTKNDVIEEMDRLAKRYKTDKTSLNDKVANNSVIENTAPINLNTQLNRPVSIIGSQNKDFMQNIPFSDDLIFFFQIQRADINQEFTIYYNILFDSGREHWIGFKKGVSGSTDLINSGEYTKEYNFEGLSICYEQSIVDTLKERGINNIGQPKQVLLIRIRGSDTIIKPIAFTFGFKRRK